MDGRKHTLAEGRHGRFLLKEDAYALTHTGVLAAIYIGIVFNGRGFSSDARCRFYAAEFSLEAAQTLCFVLLFSAPAIQVLGNLLRGYSLSGSAKDAHDRSSTIRDSSWSGRGTGCERPSTADWGEDNLDTDIKVKVPSSTEVGTSVVGGSLGWNEI